MCRFGVRSHPRLVALGGGEYRTSSLHAKESVLSRSDFFELRLQSLAICDFEVDAIRVTKLAKANLAQTLGQHCPAPCPNLLCKVSFSNRQIQPSRGSLTLRNPKPHIVRYTLTTHTPLIKEWRFTPLIKGVGLKNTIKQGVFGQPAP